MVGALEDLHVVVVGAGQHGRPRVEAEDAALVHVAVLGTGVAVAGLRAQRHPRAAVSVYDGSRPFGGSVISDVRRVPDTVVPSANQNRFVAAGVAGRRRRVDAARGPRFEHGHVLVGQELLVGHLLGPLQRRDGG